MANKKAKGKRAKTRRLIKGKKRLKGLSQEFLDLKENTGVQIVIDGSTHSGMPFKRFHGRTGKIIGKKGKCYEVRVKDGNLEKTVLAHPNHLKVIG